MFPSSFYLFSILGDLDFQLGDETGLEFDLHVHLKCEAGIVFQLLLLPFLPVGLGVDLQVTLNGEAGVVLHLLLPYYV